MMTRRNLFAGGLLAGMAGTSAQARGMVQAGGDQGDKSIDALRKVLEDIRSDLRNDRACTPTPCPEVEMIRQQQRLFLKASNKFPDFIDVGIDIWERLCDWHVKTQQRLAISRTGDGRYAMTVGVTTVVLRHEMTGNYVGLGYDSR
jgi:hypothetical protein